MGSQIGADWEALSANQLRRFNKHPIKIQASEASFKNPCENGLLGKTTGKRLTFDPGLLQGART